MAKGPGRAILGELGAALVVLTALVLVGGCAHSAATGAAAPATGCGSPVNERLDPRSSIHLFPSAADPTYLTDPPTSGPHRLGPPYRGVDVTPIARSSQVAMLESGFVIVQHQGLSPTDAAIVGALAAPLVTVAPPVGTLPSPVVVTAWTWKLQCRSLTAPALAAIRAFIAAHQGVGFAGNLPTTTPSLTSS